MDGVSGGLLALGNFLNKYGVIFMVLIVLLILYIVESFCKVLIINNIQGEREARNSWFVGLIFYLLDKRLSCR